jgi:hypothetical protein
MNNDLFGIMFLSNVCTCQQAGGIGFIFNVVDIVQAAIALATDGKTEGGQTLIDKAYSLEESASTLQRQLERARSVYSLL